MLVMMPLKLTLSVLGGAGGKQLKRGVSSVAGGQHVFNKCCLTCCIWVVNQFNGARTGNQGRQMHERCHRDR